MGHWRSLLWRSRDSAIVSSWVERRLLIVAGIGVLITPMSAIFASPPAASSLKVSTGPLPVAICGGGYSATLAATGGSTPYTWSIASGTLPHGLSLSASGSITGTAAPPSSPNSINGTSKFTVRVTDSASPPQSATKSLVIKPQVNRIWNSQGEASFGFAFQSCLGESGAVMSRGTTYSYAPSAIYNPSTGEILMWFCSGTTAGNHGDGIWFSASNDYGVGGTWSQPVEVIRSSNSTGHNDYLDGWQVCDPSVVMADNYYYIAYTGSTNWTVYGRYSSWCPSSVGEGNCDNRIFLARVRVGSEAQPTSYEKLVDVGECAATSCFQWQPFWQNNDLYPPVPIVRNEIGPVWRQAGTGTTGATTPQTTAYGIGQPSIMNLGGDARLFFTFAFNPSDTTDTGNACAGIDECVWQRPAADFTNAFAMQDYASYYQRPADIGNDVNYDVAWDATASRYVATIGKQINEGPRIMYSETTSLDVTGNATPSASSCAGPTATQARSGGGSEIISCSLDCQMAAVIPNTEGYAHNAGLLRDQYGNLISSPGHAGGAPYYWVYYSDHINLPSNNWNIVRIPWTRRSITPPLAAACP